MIQEIFCSGHIRTISNCFGLRRSIYRCSGCSRRTVYLRTENKHKNFTRQNYSRSAEKN